MKTLASLLLTLATFAVAGCSGGSIFAVAPTQFAAAPSNVMTSIFDGSPLPARGLVLRDTASNGLLETVETPASYAYNKATQTVTIQVGETMRDINLSGADANIEIASNYVTASFPEFMVFEVWGNQLDEFWAGTADTKYLIPISSYAENASKTHIDRNYAVIGLETPRAALEAISAPAFYSGYFVTENYTQGDTTVNDRHRVFGTVSLNFDFATNTLASGQLNVTSDALGTDANQTRSGSMIVQSGIVDVANNTFTAGLSSNMAGLTFDAGAQITGGFYGDAAQELGGTLTYTGRLDGKPVVAGGVMSANKN